MTEAGEGLLEATTVVVPFRLASARFPGKALARFQGRTLLEHALSLGAALSTAELVLTAPAEDLATVEAALDLSRWRVARIPSRLECRCATDRLLEIQDRLPGDRFLSLPVDEPALDARALRRALAGATAAAGATTFYCPFHARQDYLSPLSAKLVLDREGRLLYMSRAVIPVAKDGSVEEAALKKNVGVFLFERSYLERLRALSSLPTRLDRHEGLEQLRWLELGLPLHCQPIEHIGFGVDVPEQLALLEERVRCREL